MLAGSLSSSLPRVFIPLLTWRPDLGEDYSGTGGRVVRQRCSWLQPNRKGLLSVSVGTVRNSIWAASVPNRSGFVMLE